MLLRCRVSVCRWVRSVECVRVAERGRRSSSTFPHITLSPTSYHNNEQVHLDIYTRVHAEREGVWAGDKALSLKSRSSRKLTTLERLSLLADEGSEVIHIGSLAGLDMPYGNVVNGSMEVAIVTVCGQMCVVTGNDWTIKGGTIYPIGVKKQLRGQEIALQNNLPCIYIADSGGAFLPLQAGLYPDKEHGGRVFRNQAVLSSQGIPQIAVVMGPCTAGGAYIPAMSDEAVIVQDIGTLYIAGPPLVKAATGVTLSAEELGGALVHCSVSGCTDHYALTEEEALKTTRSIVESLSLNEQCGHSQLTVEKPLAPDTDEEWSRLLPTHFNDWSIMEILGRLLDGSRLRQFKERYGTGLVTGFARVGGHLVGVVASNGELGWEEGLKGAHFVRLASLRSIPLLFLMNTLVDKHLLSPSGSDGYTAKGQAQLMASIVSAAVPKITVVMGGAYGTSYYAMCGRPMNPHFLFHWPYAQCGWTDSPTLSSTHQELKAHSEGSTMMSSDLVSDSVILPSETRKVLTQCLGVITRYKKHSQPQDLSVLRM